MLSNRIERLLSLRVSGPLLRSHSLRFSRATASDQRRLCGADGRKHTFGMRTVVRVNKRSIPTPTRGLNLFTFVYTSLPASARIYPTMAGISYVASAESWAAPSAFCSQPLASFYLSPTAKARTAHSSNKVSQITLHAHVLWGADCMRRSHALTGRELASLVKPYKHSRIRTFVLPPCSPQQQPRSPKHH